MTRTLLNNPFRHGFLIVGVLALLFLSSCKNYMSLSVTEPPIVFVSDNVQSIGVVNRSFLKGGSSAAEVIDAGLSLEGPTLDREGSNSMVEGCKDRLTGMARFENVVVLDSMYNTAGSPDQMPSQMGWDEVEKICLENDVQLLFVLEMFDTDTRVDYDTRTKKVPGPLGTEIPLLQHRATMWVNIHFGWRIYDPSNKTIADWVRFRDRHTSNSGWTVNPVEAAAGLMGREDAVRQIGRENGELYANRIVSNRVRVRRQYFTRGSRMMRVAHRRALANDWDGAAEIWEKETQSSKRKVAGRANYNMAIISEIRGDLDAAINYATISYADYNRRMGRDYARVLRNRQRRIEQARQIEEEINGN